MRNAATWLGVTFMIAACSAHPGKQPRTRQIASNGPNDGPAFNFFVGKGLTELQAAGVVGNLDQESSCDPGAVQYGGGPGRGIAQWSVGGRWDGSANDNVVDYAAGSGADPWSLDLQLNFIWYELTNFGYGLSDLQASTTLADATVIFQNQYEICGQCEQSTRIAFAQHVLDTYGHGGGSDCSVHSDGMLYCSNIQNSAIYADTSLNSAAVDYLRSTYSYFDCWTTGDSVDGGNSTWYHTNGDDAGSWGFVPSISVYTTDAFDADPSARGLAHCN